MYQAFADEIMFITENPTETISKLFEVIKKIGELVDFYINEKTKIMCKI